MDPTSRTGTGRRLGNDDEENLTVSYSADGTLNLLALSGVVRRWDSDLVTQINGFLASTRDGATLGAFAPDRRHVIRLQVDHLPGGGDPLPL